MTASLESILRGLSSVLGVAVVALLPAACESSIDGIGGVSQEEAVGVVMEPAALEQGSAENEVGACLDADSEQVAQRVISSLPLLDSENGPLDPLAFR